jgi:hypothetical protein
MSAAKCSRIAAGAVTVVSSVLIATRRIGDLAALWYPLIALGAIVVLGAVGVALRKTPRERS